MRILYDHQIFSTQRYGGISRYFVNMYQHLGQTPGVSTGISALYSENGYVKGLDIPMNNGLGRKLFSGHQNRIYRWNQRYSNYKIRQGNFDVFHPTYYDTYFLKELKKPFVLTVHDMIHEQMEDHFTDNNQVVAQKKLLLEKAAAVIAISGYTRDEIMKYHPDAGPKISVIHHGYQFADSETDSLMDLPERYLLFVGERHFYKNFTGFIKAAAGLLTGDASLRLICAGGGKFTGAELQLFAELDISEKCSQLSATDRQLRQLYQHATVFVFPSFAEGFGIPLLEAFNAGCPIAASDNTCFPEIGADAIAYFDPYNAESMANAINSVLTDVDQRNALIAKGRERLKHFSIAKQTAETLEVYKKVAGK